MDTPVLDCAPQQYRTCGHRERGGRVPHARRLAGYFASIGLQAKVSCDSSTTATKADGTFGLTLPAAHLYTCVVTPPEEYAHASFTLDDPSGDHVSLTFGTLDALACVEGATPTEFLCPAPTLRNGEINGAATYPLSGTAAVGTTVSCVETSDQVVGQTFSPTAALTTRASADGQFTLPNVPVGTYGCVASTHAGAQSLRVITVQPASATRLDYSLCQRDCPTITYLGSQVMHTSAAYLIFWRPSGYAFDRPGGDSAFEATIGQYFRDVGGSALCGVLTQYWDYQGAIQNTAALGGVYLDTTPYQHCTVTGQCTRAAATVADPLSDGDIEAEISRAMTTNHWSGGLSHQFFVFLADGAQECQGSGNSATCTYIKDNAAFCGYHSWFQNTGQPAPVICATISDADTARDACLTPLQYLAGTAPHGDWIVDAEISTVSHEQFESVTDPIATDNNVGGWFDANTHQMGDSVEEIADRCQNTFGNIGADGANVTLAGHRYLVCAGGVERCRGRGRAGHVTACCPTRTARERLRRWPRRVQLRGV